MSTTEDLAGTYFSAWNAGDFDAMASVLADDVNFVGPMGTANGLDECLGGLRGVRGMVDEIAVVKRWVDGPDALTWFELRRTGKEPVPTTNWSHVENGRINRIRVAFDPRPLLGS
jgi:hypothetical protein